MGQSLDVRCRCRFVQRVVFCILAWMVIASRTSLAQGRGDLVVGGLRCEGLASPLGIESLHPKLSWRLEARSAALRGVRQTAYRVLAATTPERLTERDADLWDSAKVSGEDNAWIPYGGRPLPAASRCWWKVQVWDQQGRSSGWSRPARWDTGLYQEALWGAQWIGAPAALEAEGAPGFRKILIRPNLLPGLTSVQVYHDSPHGRIRSEWTRKGDTVRFHIVIPPGTTARLSLPLPPHSKGRITESGKPIEHSPGVRRLPDLDRRAIFLVESGDFTFAVP